MSFFATYLTAKARTLVVLLATTYWLAPPAARVLAVNGNNVYVAGCFQSPAMVPGATNADVARRADAGGTASAV